MKKRIASEITALTMLARTFVKMVVNFIYTSFGGAPPGAVPKFLIVYRSRRDLCRAADCLLFYPKKIIKGLDGGHTSRLCRVVQYDATFLNSRVETLDIEYHLPRNFADFLGSSAGESD